LTLEPGKFGIIARKLTEDLNQVISGRAIYCMATCTS
jgi:hypothetical protein